MAEPELDPQRERELARRARDGDRQARDVLIRSGLRHVVQRARMLGFRGDAFDDAVQCGCLGLIRAVDRFDPDRGVRLRTFAWWWIGDAMRAAVPRADDELPDELVDPAAAEVDTSDLDVDSLPDVLRLRYRIGEESDRPRTRREVAALLGTTESQVRAREAEAMRQLRRGLARIVHRAPVEGADPP